MKTWPSIHEYSDYRAYLRDCYTYKKRTEPGFSYSQFAVRAQLRSRVFLRLVITGKRNLSAEGIRKFSQGLNLTPHEAKAFAALVHFNQAAEFATRQTYWEAFLKLRPKNFQTHQVKDQYEYLARSFIPVLLTILQQESVSHNTTDLTRMLGLKEHEVRDGLQILKNLGLIFYEADGQYRLATSSVITTDEIHNVAIQSFHHQISHKYQHALDLPLERREFQTVLMALSDESLRYLKTRIKELAEEIDQRFSGNQTDSQYVYALNLNLFPLSETFIRRKQSQASHNVSSNEETEKGDIRDNLSI